MLIRAGAAQRFGGADSAWPCSRVPCISHSLFSSDTPLVPRRGRAVGELGLGCVGAVTPASPAGPCRGLPSAPRQRLPAAAGASQPSPRTPPGCIYSLHRKAITGKYPSPRSSEVQIVSWKRGQPNVNSRVGQASSKRPTDPGRRRRPCQRVPGSVPTYAGFAGQHLDSHLNRTQTGTIYQIPQRCWVG